MLDNKFVYFINHLKEEALDRTKWRARFGEALDLS